MKTQEPIRYYRVNEETEQWEEVSYKTEWDTKSSQVDFNIPPTYVCTTIDENGEPQKHYSGTVLKEYVMFANQNEW